MNYNQLAFWLLFLAVYLGYRRLGHRGQNWLLLVASYVFYGSWDPRFLVLILVSTAIDYIGGLGVAGVRLPARRLLQLAALLLVSAAVLLRDVKLVGALAGALVVYGLALPHLYAARSRKKAFLVVSMVANLGILGFFKYCDFFIGSLHDLLATFGLVHGDAPVLHILLPAGISFYTFQAMSYTIDIYRGEVEPTERFDDFALFVCFFPHLVAGPIMRAHTLLPQVVQPRVRKPGAFEEGLVLVVVGLFKKMVVADNLATIVNAIFTDLGRPGGGGLTGAEALVGIYAFAFQIYGDFSGYSAVARGISKWLGFELVVNFHQPYLATTPSDFWRRWHISLSSWLRDYLYIPLGGSRHGRTNEYRNLLLTMLLGGLWHGARWTFVAWGLYHGVILCVYKLLGVKDVRPADGTLRWLFRLVVMFHLTCAGWLLFRADQFVVVTRALTLIATDFHVTQLAVTAGLLLVFYCAALFLLELLTDGENRLRRLVDAPLTTQGAVYAYLTVMILIFHARRAHDFIYFQF